MASDRYCNNCWRENRELILTRKGNYSERDTYLCVPCFIKEEQDDLKNEITALREANKILVEQVYELRKLAGLTEQVGQTGENP